MSPSEHNVQRDRVVASIGSIHHPDVYRARPNIPSRETQVAAVKLNEALAHVAVTRRVGVAGEQAASELAAARKELRERVRADIERSRQERRAS